jgi:hypothetical protein
MSDASQADPKPIDPLAGLATATLSSPDCTWDMTSYFKAFAGLCLGGSVLALVLHHDLPVTDYIALVVTPGLAALGLHRAG